MNQPTLNIDELERLALAATPGNWSLEWYAVSPAIHDADGNEVVRYSEKSRNL